MQSSSLEMELLKFLRFEKKTSKATGVKKSRPNFELFDTPVKLRGMVSEMFA